MGLRLVPLESEHATFHDAGECSASQEHWARHGFGPWAVFYDERFAGVAEIHYAAPGITGISTDEVEVGWEIVPELRGRGLATETMRLAIEDAWKRTAVTHLVAYIRPENAASLRVAEKLGFRQRGEGLTRSGDPMFVFELRKTLTSNS